MLEDSHGNTYFVVEATLLIQEIEIFVIGFAPPKIEVGNLKITPN